MNFTKLLIGIMAIIFSIIAFINRGILAQVFLTAEKAEIYGSYDNTKIIIVAVVSGLFLIIGLVLCLTSKR
ncbi:MAG TPA: hypothetical protein VN426_12740 [Syntrophomonadaceae bacterium]|nr:hypothetical protein [Syntrophomonadaceae bacterium]